MKTFNNLLRFFLLSFRGYILFNRFCRFELRRSFLRPWGLYADDFRRFGWIAVIIAILALTPLIIDICR
ncbi:MAG: hypothetical protein HDS14_00400 [Bacteroides sp.]|nr:hypothetical protein [Bacteroides sp.]